MSTDTSLSARAHEENWLPVLELAAEEVFEIMLGSRVKPAPQSQWEHSAGFTAMVGLAGVLCGVLTISCEHKTARRVAVLMLGDETVASPEQICDALGEVANMVAGNFKSKLTGTDGHCMLSIPTVIKGEEYTCHSLAEGQTMETVLLLEGERVAIRLQLHNSDNAPPTPASLAG